MPPELAAPPVAETPAAEVATEPAATEAKPKPESLQEQWDRISEKVEGSEGEPESATAKDGEKPDPAAEKPKAAKKKTVEPEPKPANELEALRQQAARLGFTIEDGRVTTKERAEFREAKRQTAERHAAAERELLAKLEKARAEAEPQFERANKLNAAIEAGDWDALAETLGFKPVPAVGDKPGLSAWDALIQDQVDRKADPNYQRLRKLELDALERAERDAKAAEEAQRNQTEAERRQARANYQQQLSAGMKSSKDPLVAAFHDDPGFVNAIFQIQEQEYQATGTAPAPEQASRMKLRGVNETPREWLERMHKRLAPVFSAPAATTPAPAATEQPAAKTPAKGPVSRTTNVPKPAARPAGKWRNDRAEKEAMIARMEEAVARDLAEERKAKLASR